MADDWQLTQSLPDLAPGELQIWRIDLAEATDSRDIYSRHLSSEEQERANRLRAGQVRQQFLVARTCLRFLLGNALNLDPKAVSITLNAYGKPETPPAAGSHLYFNLAHSRETILVALSRDNPVGIDLEYLDRETEVLDVARNFFHPEEFHQIAAIADPELQRRAFFHCWTRKEAIIKADGRGLSLPLTAFRVPVLEPAVTTQVVISDESNLEISPESGTPVTARYLVSDLALDDRIAAAFATAVPCPGPRKLLFPLAAL